MAEANILIHYDDELTRPERHLQSFICSFSYRNGLAYASTKKCGHSKPIVYKSLTTDTSRILALTTLYRLLKCLMTGIYQWLNLSCELADLGYETHLFNAKWHDVQLIHYERRCRC